MAKYFDRDPSEKSDFRVIIVGGSVAGLTLSHCLNRAGIDNIVLERKGDLAPCIGASIGILPNGGRILEQLGILSAVEDVMDPLEVLRIQYEDGFTFKCDLFADMNKT
jgi:FAD dependent monooxygenase